MTTTERLKLLGPGLALLLCGSAGIAAPQFLPADGERMAVIAPGADALGIVAAAGGEAISTTGTGIVAVSSEPGFAGRLYRSGAWLVLRFDGLLGCLTFNPKELDDERS